MQPTSSLLDASKSSWPRRWAWVPVALAAMTAAVLWRLDLRTIFEPPLLMPTLNLVFFIGASVLAAVLAARGYLAGAGLSVLLLGAGMLTFGLGCVVGSAMVGLGRVNAGVTAHNLLAALAGIIHLASASLLLLGWTAPPRGSRGKRLAAIYAVCVAAATTAAVLAAAGMLPAFITPGGGTPLRGFVLTIAAAAFLLAALHFAAMERHAATAFLRWYWLGLALIGLGLASVGLGWVGSPLSWAGRLTQSLGQAYVVLCLLALRRQGQTDGPARADPFQQLEQALRQSEQRCQQLLEVLPVAICTCDAAGVITYCNDQAARLWGRAPRPGETEPRFCGALRLYRSDGSPLPHAQTSVAAAIAQGRSFRNQDVIMERPDGSRISVLVNVDPLRNPRGEITGAINVFLDTTERRQAEQELRHAQAEAERANSAKDAFIAALSHELRTPLTPVMAAVGLLARDVRLPQDLREDARMIQRNISLEVALINDLLDVTRISHGKLSLQREPVDAARIIRDAAAICAAELDARNLTLTIDAPGAPCPVNADAARLHQVFWNLIKNAIKFTPGGGRISVRCEMTNSGTRGGSGSSLLPTVHVHITDTGIGIEPQLLGRLFGAFEQGNRADGFGGLGLGLAIVKGIIRMHGGDVRAASAGKGKGATFSVELPLLPAGTATSNGDRAPSTAVAHETRTLRILLVEDHADTARMMSRLLAAEGHAVMHAASVKAALAAAENGEYDVLMSDLGLPDGSGYDLMRQLIAAGKKLPGIAVSGYGMAADIEKGRQAGFLGHVTKPIDFDALHQALLRIAVKR